ncbi:hypothetical protein SUGI_0268830 [Cryptomeria japonica]|uniref:uncharacterized protein LOC131078414 n=1 Tax=Cryptomeria japonica TaxID=3369 RepID=UPI002408EE69|nr:uncharacterized protein LOC131078414 [Cryptomeria japonica]GLJ16126.1 hypothetical protein SUGI_0268830 [Cryptomeria japonica]
MAHQHNLHQRRATTDALLAPELHYASLHLKQKPLLWDCDSSLYDSFELFTFTQHLQRAIAAEGPLLSAYVTKDGRARSLSMPHYAFTPTPRFYNPVVKEDVDFSHHSKIEPLHLKTRSRVRVPKLVQRLFTKSKTGEKQHDFHSKAGRTSFERLLYTATHYC